MSTRFKFTDAVFFMPLLFFKRPLAGLWVAIWAFMPFVILFGGMYLLGLEDLLPETAPDGSFETIPSIPVLVVLYAGVIFALIALYSIWLRFLVRDESGGLWPIGLGGDELRLAVTLLIIFVIFGVAMMLAISPVMFLAFSAGAAEADTSNTMPGPFVLIAVLLAIGFFVWVSVRLSPIFAWSIQQRSIVAFSVWNVSKRAFWPFFGAILVSNILSTVLQVVGTLPAMAIGGVAVLGGDMSAETDNLPMLASAALGAYFVLLFSIMIGYLLGPMAYVVRWHAGTLPVEMQHHNTVAAVTGQTQGGRSVQIHNDTETSPDAGGASGGGG
jgi:hypothetical protein